MSDYNSVQKRLNMIVGSFVLMAILAFIWFISIFGEMPLVVTRHRSFEVFAQFPSAPGVQKNTPVQYCGYRIGKVFMVNPPDRLVHLVTGETINQVKVGLAIDNTYEHKIPINVDIRVVTRSMGSSYIEIFDRKEKPAGFVSRKVETFQGSVGSSTEFIPKEVQKKLEILVEKMSVFSTDLHVILGDEGNQKNIAISLENFVSASAKAQDTLESLKSFSDKGQEAVVSVAEELDGTLKDLRLTLKNINEGGGTVSKLITDPSLHENLLEASRELQIVLEQIKLLAAETREKGVKLAL